MKRGCPAECTFLLLKPGFWVRLPELHLAPYICTDRYSANIQVVAAKSLSFSSFCFSRLLFLPLVFPVLRVLVKSGAQNPVRRRGALPARRVYRRATPCKLFRRCDREIGRHDMSNLTIRAGENGRCAVKTCGR